MQSGLDARRYIRCTRCREEKHQEEKHEARKHGVEKLPSRQNIKRRKHHDDARRYVCENRLLSANWWAGRAVKCLVYGQRTNQRRSHAISKRALPQQMLCARTEKSAQALQTTATSSSSVAAVLTSERRLFNYGGTPTTLAYSLNS